MKASQFSDAQKAFILKRGNDGIPVEEIVSGVWVPPYDRVFERRD